MTPTLLATNRPGPILHSANEARTDAGSVASLPQDVKMSILVGGTITAKKREDIQQGKRARNDVIEMEQRYNAQILDIERFVADARKDSSSRQLRFLAGITHQWPIFLAWYALKKIQDNDLVYATGEDVGFPLALLMKLFRVKKGPRLVVRLEQPTYGRSLFRKFLYNLYMKAASERIDSIVCRTTAHLQYLNSIIGIPLHRLSFTHESTDQDFYCCSSLAQGEESSEVDTSFIPKGPFIVSAGLEMRDYETLIKAAQDLPIHVVIGAGSPWAKVVPPTATSSPDQTPPSNVTMRSFTPVQMRALYDAAAFVVVPVKPTLRACGMNVVLEGWAMGKGVIVTRTTGQLDYSQNGETALFVEPGNVADLRSKILYLLQNPTEAKRLGRNGLKFVQTYCNLDGHLQRMERIFASVLDKNNDPV